MSEPQPSEKQLLLTAWLDGELPPAEQTRFERMRIRGRRCAARIFRC